MSVTSAASGQTSEPFAARAALLLVAFLWGVNYIATNFGLRAFSPWTFRTLSFLAGAGLLAILAPMIGASLRVRKVSDRFHLIVSGLFACGGFGALAGQRERGRLLQRIGGRPFQLDLFTPVVIDDPRLERQIVRTWRPFREGEKVVVERVDPGDSEAAPVEVRHGRPFFPRSQQQVGLASSGS